MKSNWQSITIIVAAIITAMPRWIIALLAAEGIVIPPEWKSTWIVISAILAASMAVVEGFAFAYIFRAWRSQSGKAAEVLLGLSIAAAAVFVFTLAPSMAASVRGITVHEFLKNDLLLLFWTFNVAMSTILVVIATGYSEKVSSVDPKLQESREEVKELKAQLKSLEKANEWKWLWNGSTKKEKVYHATKTWPDLPQKAIAEICDTSETYVSQNQYRE